jgi:hypothetical protein
MKLNHTIAYVLYFGMAIMLSPLKLSYSIPGTQVEKKKEIVVKPSTKAKAEVLHSELLFKY